MNVLRSGLAWRRRSVRVGLVVLATLALLTGVGVALQSPAPTPDAPPQTTGELAATAPAEATTPIGGGEGAGAAPRGTSRHVPAAATVSDVPRAWKRIAEQARSWPAATTPPALGKTVELPTVPASRMRDTLAVNIDLWRTEYGYADFSRVLAKVTELRLRHARVNMQARGEHGLTRMQQLGKLGVRLDVLMGDALGRYNTTPFDELRRRVADHVLPYVDSVEGTNEPDLSKDPSWVAAARGHQGAIVQSARGVRGKPVAVVAPSVGRIANTALLGSYAGLADAANAHAYSSAGEPSAPLDEWTDALADEVPGGRPIVVTEAGFQTDLGQTEHHTPLPEEIAADYTPRIILEAIRRGMPRVYLYELIDRWNDPFGIDTAAHFGLLRHDLTPKPAWPALVRLQRALLDGGAPDARPTPVRATVVEGPADLRVLAFRRTDGTTALALWRAVSEWDTTRLVKTPARPEPVRLEWGTDVGGALATNIATGARVRLPASRSISARVDGAPVVITGLPR